ncbi:MAG: hypothetical protein AAGD22_00880 [Verrucomicrobiota bacterium]
MKWNGSREVTASAAGTGILVGLMAIVLSACTSLGPRVMKPAQFEYNEAIGGSWNEQLLLNVVRIHYRDTPVFLEVDQILAGYTFETEAHAGLSVLPQVGSGVDRADGSLRGSLVERPTVTLTPLQGEAFTSRLLTPIAPETLLLLAASGWQVERVMLCCVQQINDLRNLPATLDADLDPPESFSSFREVAQELEDVQQSDGLGIRVTVDGEGRSRVTIEGAGADYVRERMDLPSGRDEIPLTPAYAPAKPDEITLTGRSFLGVLTFLSRYVEAPPEHREAGLVEACADTTQGLAGPLFQVQSSDVKPKDVFVAVKYRGHWFSVPDSNLDAKETFGLLTQLFSLQASGQEGRSPLLTIPAG